MYEKPDYSDLSGALAGRNCTSLSFPKDILVPKIDLCRSIVVPHNNRAYTALCETVSRLEGEILSILSSHKQSLSPEQAKTFDDILSDNPITRKLLSRTLLANNEGKYIGAGIYLGSHKTDYTMGHDLYYCLTGAMGKCSDRSLEIACTKWGDHQARARQKISNGTWRTLIGRCFLDAPEDFSRNLASLLEPDLIDRLRVAENDTPVGGEQPVLFMDWLVDINIIYDQGKSKGVSRKSPDLPTPAIPDVYQLKAQSITEIRISLSQALDYWSRYLAISSLQEIEITIPLS
jgi:hypothetical protein